MFLHELALRLGEWDIRKLQRMPVTQLHQWAQFFARRDQDEPLSLHAMSLCQVLEAQLAQPGRKERNGS